MAPLDNPVNTQVEKVSCDIKMGLQHVSAGRTHKFKIELWNSGRPAGIDLPARLRQAFTEGGYASIRVRDTEDGYDIRVKPSPMDVEQNLEWVATGKYSRTVVRKIGVCRDAGFIMADLKSILGYRSPKNKFRCTPHTATVEGGPAGQHLLIRVTKEWLRNDKISASSQSRYHRPLTEGHEEAKQMWRERLWLDQQSGLLPPGVYERGKKIVLMPGSSSEEVRILVRERGVHPSDIVMFEINPAIKANLTRKLEEILPGQQPSLFGNIIGAGNVELPDGPLTGKVIAANFDLCQCPSTVLNMLYGILRSGIMAPTGRLSVTYSACHDHEVKAFLDRVGWQDENENPNRARLMSGIVHEAGFDGGGYMVQTVYPPCRYTNNGNAMEVVRYGLGPTPTHESLARPEDDDSPDDHDSYVPTSVPSTAPSLSRPSHPEYFVGHMDALISIYGYETVLNCLWTKLPKPKAGR